MILNPAFCRIFPFAIYIGFLILDSVFSILKAKNFEFVATWNESWIYPVKILMVMLAILWLWRKFTELAIPVNVKWVDWLIGIFVGVAVFVLWINLDQPWATIGVSNGYNPTNPVSQEIDWVLVAIRIFGASIVVPVMEELFWRSFLLRWQMKTRFLEVNPAKVSIQVFVVTALLFACEHNLIVAGFIAGAAYSWLYMRTRNLWVPIVAHSVTNGMLGVWVLSTHNWQFW
jgi:CAAX prenyl protease-like protein